MVKSTTLINLELHSYTAAMYMLDCTNPPHNNVKEHSTCLHTNTYMCLCIDMSHIETTDMLHGACAG